jgi:hypothetical protein
MLEEQVTVDRRGRGCSRSPPLRLLAFFRYGTQRLAASNSHRYLAYRHSFESAALEPAERLLVCVLGLVLG